MAAVLNGGLAAVFGAAFGGLYLPALVHVPAEVEYDAGGSIVPGVAAEPVPCRVQVDGVTEAMRRAEGFSERDMRLMVLAAGLGTEITTDCRVEVLQGPHAGLWLVASVARDPAGAYWDCRGRRG